MDELAREIGVSKKTLYVHFPTKQALIEEVLLAKAGELEAALAAVRAAHESNPVRALNELLVTWRQQISEIQPVFLRDLRLETPELFQRIAARRHALVNRHFGGLLEQGRDAGSIRGDVPIGFIVDVFMATVNEIGRPEKVDELGIGPREIFSNLTSLLIEGVLTDKGRSRWNAFKLSTAKSDAASTAAAPRRAATTAASRGRSPLSKPSAPRRPRRS